jgi:MoxR-like ATPase
LPEKTGAILNDVAQSPPAVSFKCFDQFSQPRATVPHLAFAFLSLSVENWGQLIQPWRKMMNQEQQSADMRIIENLRQARKKMQAEIGKVIIGQSAAIELLTQAMLSRGHCLLVGVPGLAKTLMISTLAKVMHLSFNRIQFTPDLMPSDITGTDVIEEDRTTGRREFRFVKGPLFANIILADEINRTPPKTQSALLQAMQEYHITAGGQDFPLDLPFFVLATQNPIEQEGTYPLPEAQLDRFMFMVNIDYPSRDEERVIVKSTTSETPAEPEPVLSGEDILALQRVVRKIPVSQHVVDYAVNIVRASRPDDPTATDFVKQYLTWGAGPRAAQYLVLGAKSRALLSGRFNVSAEDVRAIAKPVMRHRLFTNFNADAEGITTDAIIDLLIQAVPEPQISDYQNISNL